MSVTIQIWDWKLHARKRAGIIRLLVMMGKHHSPGAPVPALVCENRKKLIAAMSGPSKTADIKDWIAAQCTTGSGLTLGAADGLRNLHSWWYAQLGEECKNTSKTLKAALEALGFPYSRNSQTRHYVGLALNINTVAMSNSVMPLIRSTGRRPHGP